MEHSTEQLLAVPGYLPLALRVGVAEQRAAMYSTYLRTLPPSIDAAKHSVLTPRRKYTGLRVQGNVGIIDVKGVLEKDMSWISWLMGDATYEEIQDQLRDALARDEVTKVLLLIDSPGGTVYGIDETRTLIQAVDKKKPVMAHSNGCMCSAAYAIGSAARKITMSEMSEAGSIGVVLTHVDQSQFDKDMGFKVTEITAGEFKRAGSAHKPLDKKSMDYLQQLVDKHMSVFKGWVQASRNYTDAELEQVANGKVFIGTDALDVGLIDRIATYDDVLTSMLDEQPATANLFEGVLTMEKNTTVVLTMASLLEQAPQLAEELRKEGEARAKVANQTSIDGAAELATTNERARIKEIFELAPAGFEVEVKDMAFTNPVSASDAAKTFLKAAKEKGIALLDQHRGDAPKVVDHAPSDRDEAAEADRQILEATASFNTKRGVKNEWNR